MESHRESDKVIRFEDREYHCIAIDSEPWNHPEVELRKPWLQARLPNLKFTPCRWRFVCSERVLAAVPVGYFETRKPDAIPVEIRKKTEWYQKTQPLTEDDRNLRRMVRPSKPESVMPPKGTEKVIEDEYSAVFDYLTLKLPGVSSELLHEIMKLVEYEAIYENGNRDYFIRVEVCEPTREEAKLLGEAENRSEPAPYAIEYLGATYNIRFHGVDFSADESTGMKYIVHFIMHPRTKTNALDVYNQVMGVPLKTQKGELSEEEFKGAGEAGGIGYDRAAARDNIKNLLQRSVELNSKISLDPAEQFELKEIEAEIIKQQAKAEGRTLDYKDDFTTKKGTIKRAINRALEELNGKHLTGSHVQARDDFVQHVRMRLMQNFESSFSYEPEPDIVWQ